MKNTPMPEGQTPIRAIILMTDGEFNNYGDPLARGIGYNYSQRDSDYKYYKDNSWNVDANISHHTWFTGLGGVLKGVSGASVGTNQNMTMYALNNQPLRIYTISLSNAIAPGSVTWNTMDNLANNTGGTHYHATSTAELRNIYTLIAGELKNKAGVNTQATMDFENVIVKNVTVPGADAFNYTYVSGVSTFIHKWNTTYDYQEVRDDTTIFWNTDHLLDFSAGTIYVNDNWLATFRLKAITDGDIHIFGPSSIITFNNGVDTLQVPDTVITVTPLLENQTVESENSLKLM